MAEFRVRRSVRQGSQVVDIGSFSGPVSTGAVTDYDLEVARGNIRGVSSVNKFGRNTDVDTTEEDIHDAGGEWAAPTEARVHNITSDSANDTGDPISPGTGARTLRLYGLTDWDSEEVSEDIILDGASARPTTREYVIIHRVKILTWGSGGTNAGTILATAVTDATDTATILPGEGQTQMAVYGVPSTKTAYMTTWYASVLRSSPATVAVDMQLKFAPTPDVDETGFITKHTKGLTTSGASEWPHHYKPYKSFPGPGIIKVSATASAINADVSAGFDLYLVDNNL